ncbi:MAG TPA: hypothetical protein VF551_04430 [Chthoniobacterales bacterium]|jgi:hypothetical protein
MNTEVLAEKIKSVLPKRETALASLSAKPITPYRHALVDLFNVAVLAAAPTAFKLSGTTSQLVRVFGATEAAVNWVSDTPLAVKRALPFRMHRAIDKWSGLGFLAAALATDGLRSRRNLQFVIAQALLGFAVYNLTDWDADTDS